MRLFEVTIESVAYVWARDERHAEQLIESEVDGDAMEGADITVVNTVEKDSPVWGQWKDSEPFGDAPHDFYGLTVEEVRDKLREDYAKEDHETLPLFGEFPQ